jgi:leader peptidase (prepilin peptidase)/N-methyltransferase
MLPFAFFLLGIPMAAAADRLVLRLTSKAAGDDGERDDDGDSVSGLPWQRGGWPDRLRWGVIACLPPLMAVAAIRFDAVQAAAVSALLASLLICTATDLLRFRVPDVITYPSIVLALLAALLMPGGEPLRALVAAAAAGLVFLVLAVLTRGGIGLGDAKLAALIGASLGLPAAYEALVLGVFAAGVIILVFLLAGLVSRRQALPYAPFLALAAIAVVLVEGAAFAPR